MPTKTSMNIPHDLLQEAVTVSGVATKTMAVILGLQELIRRKRLDALLRLKGTGAVTLPKATQRRLRAR